MILQNVESFEKWHEWYATISLRPLPCTAFPCFEFPTMKKKPYLPCKVLEAKMVEREDAFKSLPLFRFLAQKKSLISSARWQMLKFTQGNCILLTWPSSRAFPCSDIALQKNLYFPWKVIETKRYKRKLHFFPRVLSNFALLQLQYCVKTLPFP